MVLGILFALLATISQNGSVVFLTIAARSRQERGGMPLLVGVVRNVQGFAGMAMNTAGWLLELLALTRISLTLDRIIMTSGLLLILVLDHRQLKETIGAREITGVLTIIAGIIAVGVMPIGRSSEPLSFGGWLVLTVLFGPVIFAPNAARTLGRTPSAILSAGGAGMAYALTAMYTKGMADAIDSRLWIPVLALLAGVVIVDTTGFTDQLAGLQRGQASVVAPIIAALRIIVPILLAPFFFGESWPESIWHRVIIGAGVVANVVGVVILSHTSARVITTPSRVADRPGA